MEEMRKCPECDNEVHEGMIVCPNCGYELLTDKKNELTKSKRKAIGLVMIVVACICFVWGVIQLTNESYKFYQQHLQECIDARIEARDAAEDVNAGYLTGYLLSTYDDIDESYAEMIEDDEKEIWNYRIKAMIGCAGGVILLLIGLGAALRKEK